MFRRFEEAKTKRVTINDVNEESLKVIIEFIYTKQIHISKENINTILSAANLLQLEGVVDECWNYWKRNLNPENCLKVNDLADFYCCSDMINYTKNYVERNFAEVVKSEDFLKLSSDQLCCLIKSNNLALHKEEICMNLFKNG